MGFSDLLDEVGGFGRFQLIHVVLLSIPGLLMASQNLLNNFTAGIPNHYCTIPNLTARATAANPAMSERDKAFLLPAFVPVIQSKPSRCSRYMQPQWHLIHPNSSQLNEENTTQMESCEDGWTYERNEFISTIVSEVSMLALR